MAVRIFCKHLFTSIKKRPAQPLLLMIIVTIAVMVSIMALELRSMIIGEQEAYFEICNGSSNIKISVSPGDNRFINPTIAEDLLGKDAEVCGIYALPFYDENGKLVKGVHSDFDNVGGIFKELDFAEIKNLQGNALTRSAVVSASFAKSRGLKQDDDFSLSLLGEGQTYRVRAITDGDIMGEYAVLVDVQATIKAIAGSAVFSEILTPYGTIYIHSHASDDALDSVIARLNEAYPNGNATQNALTIVDLSDNLNIIMKLFIMIVIMMSVATLYCCFSILTAQRVEANELFASVGSKPYYLNLVSVAEMAIYWFVGSVVGIALAVPFLRLVKVVADFEYITPKVQALPAIEASAFMFVATEFSMLLYVAVERIRKYQIRRAAIKAKQVGDVFSTKHSEKTKVIVSVCMGVLLIILSVCSVVVRYYDRRIFGIAGIALAFVGMFYCGGLVFNKVAVAMSDLKSLPVPVRYGIKNSGRVESQSNVARLMAVILMALLTLSLLTKMCMGLVDTYINIVDADYVAMNTTDSSKKHMEDLPEVASVNDMFTMVLDGCFYEKEITFSERPTGYDAPNNPNAYEYRIRKIEEFNVLAATDVSAFNKKLALDEQIGLPKDGNVYVGASNLKRYDLELGDRVSINLGGKWYEDLTIVGTFECVDTTIIIDAETLGISYNYTIIKGAEGYTDEEVYDAVFAACQTDNVVIAETKELMRSKTRNIEVFNACILMLLVVMAVFATIGIVDSVVSGYRSRKDEFACYVAGGMNKKSLLLMKTSETVFSFIVGMILVVAMFGFVLLSVYETMLSFDVNIFFCLQ